MWVYQRFSKYDENDEVEYTKFQVGHYRQPDGTFVLDTVFDTLEEASERVSFLNGGSKPSS